MESFDVSLSGKRLKIMEPHSKAKPTMAMDASKSGVGPTPTKTPPATIYNRHLLYTLLSAGTLATCVIHQFLFTQTLNFAFLVYVTSIIFTPWYLSNHQHDTMVEQHLIILHLLSTGVLLGYNVTTDIDHNFPFAIYLYAIYLAVWNLIYMSHRSKTFLAVSVISLFSIPSTFILKLFSPLPSVMFDVVLTLIIYALLCAQWFVDSTSTKTELNSQKNDL